MTGIIGELGQVEKQGTGNGTGTGTGTNGNGNGNGNGKQKFARSCRDRDNS